MEVIRTGRKRSEGSDSRKGRNGISGFGCRTIAEVQDAGRKGRKGKTRRPAWSAAWFLGGSSAAGSTSAAAWSDRSATFLSFGWSVGLTRAVGRLGRLGRSRKEDRWTTNPNSETQMAATGTPSPLLISMRV